MLYGEVENYCSHSLQAAILKETLCVRDNLRPHPRQQRLGDK